MQFNENCEELGEIGFKVLTEGNVFRKNIKNEETGETETVKVGHDKTKRSEDKYNKRGPMQHFGVEGSKNDKQNDAKADASSLDAQIGAEQDHWEHLIKLAEENIENAYKRMAECASKEDMKGVEINIQEISALNAKIAEYKQQLQMLGGGKRM